MAEKRSEGALHEERRLASREPFQGPGHPSRVLDLFAEDMQRIFDNFGLGRSSFAPRIGRSWLTSRGRGASATDWDVWTPDIDVFQRNHELIVRADLPGLRREDIQVDVTDDAITIHGERHHETEQERRDVYRSERGHGSFSRVIPLPEGSMTDQAKATFKDGVLEITMPAPPEQVTRGRKLEITEASSTKK
jgi:HSP20 family protein